MQFLNPVGLLLLALAIPILLLYMLKLRRKQVQVSSTLFWTQLLRDRQANTPWQKIKRNLLLILQLLILAALVLAFTRPALETSSITSGSLIVLLDASASMNATDVSPSRFESARKTAQSLVDGLSGDSSMTLILVGQSPQALISSETDKAVIKSALAEARPSQGVADWQSALALAAGAAQGHQEVTTVIISDGGLPESGLPAMPGEIRYVPIGASDENLAITALALRPAMGGPELFAEVRNFSDRDRSVLLSIYFGDELLSARQKDLPPGSRQNLTLDEVPAAPGVYRAKLTDPHTATSLDSLDLDDTAYAVYQPSSLRRVLLVSNGNLYLEQLLASLPGIQPFRALPGEDGTPQIPGDPFDLYILDGITPAEFPVGNLLFINPSNNPVFQVGESYSEMVNVQVHDHELTRYVDWGNVHILQAEKIQTQPWADVLVSTDAGPLVFAGETGGYRIAALAFDLKESDLPLQVAYPILFANLIDYLTPPSAFDATRSLLPGESLSISPPLGVERVVIASPTDELFTLVPSASALTFTETDKPGYYAVNFLFNGTSSADFFAVNLFAASESDIRPRGTLQIGRSAIRPADAEKVSLRELWPWLAALALLLLLIEWQAYHRKPWPLRLPARP